MCPHRKFLGEPAQIWKSRPSFGGRSHAQDIRFARRPQAVRPSVQMRTDPYEFLGFLGFLGFSRISWISLLFSDFLGFLGRASIGYMSATTSNNEEKGRKRKKDEEREVPDPRESIEDTPF